VTNPQNLNATETMVLRACQSYFEQNPYKTKLHFDELVEALDGRLVAGKLKPIVAHLIHLGCLWGSTSNTLELTARGLSSVDAVKLPTEHSFSYFCELLLVALADHDKRIKERNLDFGGFDLSEVAKLYELSFSRGWIERASEVFQARQWARVTGFFESGKDGLFSAALTGPGLLEAERLRNELRESGIAPPTYPPLDSFENIKTSAAPSAGTAPTFISSDLEAGFSVKAVSIPAADRIVWLDDNAPGRLQAIENLDQIEKLLGSGNNELKLTADERTVIVSEIKPLRERLMERRVRVGEICNAVTKGSPLVWLLDKVGGTAVGVAATAAITALYMLAKALIG
jgi:hypothetical protein